MNKDFNEAWKIFETDSSGNVKTLFHGINGSGTLEKGEVLTAVEKMVKDGTSDTYYLSGFHVLKTRQDCEDYLKSFTTRLDKLVILPILVGKLRSKEHSRSPVFLAKEMVIM